MGNILIRSVVACALSLSVAAPAFANGELSLGNGEELKLKCDEQVTFSSKVQVSWTIQKKNYTETSVVGSSKRQLRSVVANSSSELTSQPDQFYSVQAALCEDHGGQWNLWVIPFVRFEVLEIVMGRAGTFTEVRAQKDVKLDDLNSGAAELVTSFRGADGQQIDLKLVPLN